MFIHVNRLSLIKLLKIKLVVMVATIGSNQSEREKVNRGIGE